LLERKERLANLLGASNGVVRFAAHLVGDGSAVFEAARRLGAEGIVSKRANAPYRSGQRSAEWQKTKAVTHEEFVVGGFLVSAGAPLAALHLGQLEETGDLRYAGKVGTGFQSVASVLLAELKAAQIETCPFPSRSRPKGKDFREAFWTRPSVVVEVEYLAWADDGHLRHPTFRRLCGKQGE